MRIREKERERDWEGGDLYQTATFRSAEQKNYRQSTRFHFTAFFPNDLSRQSKIERTLGKWRETSASFSPCLIFQFWQFNKTDLFLKPKRH